MDRIFLVSYDGRVFYAEPESSWFEPLEEATADAEPVRIKRLSPARHSLWTVSAMFDVHVYVFASDIPIECQETTYENQRRINLLSANAFGERWLLPTDREAWSSADGRVHLPKDSFALPSASWVWESDWFHDATASDGWEFAVDFPNHYRPKLFMGACVRRRKWMRNRLFAAYKRFIKVPAPDAADCVIDP